MRLTEGLYCSGRSSPDDELGPRLVCKSEEETGRRQDMREAIAIRAVSEHEKGVVIVLTEDGLGWEVEGNLKGRYW